MPEPTILCRCGKLMIQVDHLAHKERHFGWSWWCKSCGIMEFGGRDFVLSEKGPSKLRRWEAVNS
ncbi:hypothetical protein LCGC14_2737430 [marine sediment metagenome]|uniref:Uncharacterized protein n=1 Tax=marine sediment metagenome TaxID=412755 RepID=A0A0F8Z5I1_9ZZZZ